MRLYRDIDYYLFFEDFPHIGVPGAIYANCDGTCSIYINTLYCETKRTEALRHELRHMALWHLWRDDMELREKESQADDIYADNVIFAPDFAWVEVAG